MFLMASGMLGFDCEGPTWAHRILYKMLKFIDLYKPKLFAQITKTITVSAIKGKKDVRPVKDGWWNNYQLDNLGLEKFAKKYVTKLKEKDNVIVSFAGNDKSSLFIIVNALNVLLPNLLATEFNVSCPNYRYLRNDNDFIIEMCHYIREISKFPLILKIGQRNNYIKIAKKTEKVVEAIDINSVPAKNDFGAISGKIAQKDNWQIISYLKNYTKIPIVGCSIWSYEDMIYLLEKLKVDAISFGTVSLPHPFRPWASVLPTKWVEKYLDSKITKISSLKPWLR